MIRKSARSRRENYYYVQDYFGLRVKKPVKSTKPARPAKPFPLKFLQKQQVNSSSGPVDLSVARLLVRFINKYNAEYSSKHHQQVEQAIQQEQSASNRIHRSYAISTIRANAEWNNIQEKRLSETIQEASEEQSPPRKQKHPQKPS